MITEVSITGSGLHFHHLNKIIRWVKHVIVLDSNIILCFTELAWSIGTYEIE